MQITGHMVDEQGNKVAGPHHFRQLQRRADGAL